MSWAQRHAQLIRLIDSSRVSKAREEALHAASLITQTDDNAASAVASHQGSLRIISKGCQEEILGRLLDASLAVLWSAPSYSTDSNEIRIAACSSLKSMLNVALSESSRDLSSITCLESNREGTVELVRCRMDKKIYVLKSTTKGAAKRGYRSNAPVTERRLLSLARQTHLETTKTVFTPTCIAAFQSPGSLHILMDYCPAGDLYHFLESAGEAPIANDARNKSGGLLTERYVRRYAIDMVAAISWLHEQGFMHRDIKPGNWLFDKTGHLLLCDLASAAPFALFDEVPPSGNLPEKDESRASKTKQRRVLYRNCCLIGTADYIAPEIFWSADLMSRRREKRLDRERSESYLRASRDSMDSGRTEEEEDDDDDDEPPPDGPGLYGPEVDWWSLGVVLFEMVYKRMPFFSEKIAETMEMIKHHEHYFQLDPWVQCSAQLSDLMQRLITHSEKRIGYVSSYEVKSHSLFQGVNWSKPWEGEEVPFVPKLDISSHLNSLESPRGLSLLQEEPSVLHSPRIQQDHANSTHFSQMWARDSQAFPGFPNSVELSRAAAQEKAEREEEEEQDRSEATITSSSPSAHKTGDQDRSETLSDAEQLWSGYDPTWIGFSFVPDKTQFSPTIESIGIRQACWPSPISSPDNMSNSNYLFSPQAASSSSLPMVSTPCQSRVIEEVQVPPLHLLSTPFHPSVAHNLHRRAIETASRVRSETVEARHSFATPMRKTSTPNLSSHADRQQMMSNLQTPANPSFSKSTVPASPYPFPLAATIARPKKTPGPLRVPSTGLKRADLDRARSASVETGEGSDSRCSGGSNVKRDISEREAWKELKMAVMQSARKTRKDLVKEMWEEKRKENPIEKALAKRRPPLAHAATESAVVGRPASDLQRGHVAIERETTKKSQGFGLGALSGALKGRRPALPRFLSQHQSSQSSKPAPLKPMVSMTSPERPSSIMSSSSASSSLLSQQDQSLSGTKSRLMLPNFWGKSGDSARLNKKKSTRQLLLKAQDRATPTKIASRSGSPFLTSFQNISLGDEVSRQEGVSPHSKVPASQATSRAAREPSVASKAMMSLDSDDSTISLQTGIVQPVQDENRQFSSPPKSALITQLRREEGTTRFAMKRRDSREMLSQYRQGINPDETYEELDTAVTQHNKVNLAVRRGPKRVMSIQVLQPTTTNRSIGGISGSESLSSPSLPCFPDAFGGSFGNKKSLQDIRRASMVPHTNNTLDKADVSKGLATIASNQHQFRSLQQSRSRTSGLASSKLNILEGRTKNSTYTKKVSPDVPTTRGDVVGEMSMMSGLDWRYTSMQVNITQIEERLERLKARLRED